jgi:hypothetical protein
MQAQRTITLIASSDSRDPTMKSKQHALHNLRHQVTWHHRRRMAGWWGLDVDGSSIERVERHGCFERNDIAGFDTIRLRLTMTPDRCGRLLPPRPG